MRTLLIFFCLVCFSDLPGAPTYVVIHHHKVGGRGFFSIMDYVFTCIDWIETHPKNYNGLEIDFERTGMYYDPLHGPNYWNYFFKPCKTGRRLGKTFHAYSEFRGQSPFHNESLDKFLIHERIQRYMHLTDEMELEIQNFVDLHFSGKYVIGVHYRGTDKGIEAKILTYQDVLKEIQLEIDNAPENWHIFLATDEQNFLNYLLEKFPGRVSYLEEVQRSINGKPIHMHAPSPYMSGKTAVMDCVLLSRTDMLLRTCSNLSRWSTYFNPWLNDRELTKRR